MDEILKDEIDYVSLKNKLEGLKALLISLTGLELENQENKQDIHFDNGMALSTTFAALCIDDIVRTRQFVRGIYKAIKDQQLQKSGSVNVFYAGTGPFATLVLPILTRFKSDELRVTLLDVNQKTLAHLRRLIRQLNIENYTDNIYCADATTFKFEGDLEIDILVSETMQHGLVKEQQVPIMINLVEQLPSTAIIIPQNIRLELALMNSNVDLILNGKQDLKYKKIITLLDFNKDFLETYIQKTSTTESLQQFDLGQRIPFRIDNTLENHMLVILTSIQVYGNEWIDVDSSGLTIPKILFDLERVSNELHEISLSYIVNKNPDFEYHLS